MQQATHSDPQVATNTAPVTSYFQQRMQEIGVTENNALITVHNPEAEFPQPESYTTPIFTEDKSTGDIEILYYTIEGDLISYLHQGDGKTSYLNAKTRLYKTRRLKEPKGDMKYQMPAGQPTLPWFPPALVEKYQKGEQVPTLILTEGVFKAMCGSIAGLDVVGLASISTYKGKDGKLYSDITKLIERCNVQTVIIMWDADCLNISAKDLQITEEITRRPSGFFNSAKKIAELVTTIEYTQTREKPQVYFSHVRFDALETKPKGLDDLIIQARDHGKVPAIVQQAQRPHETQYFFKSLNITSSTASLLKYFRLHDHEAFFDAHRDQIGAREFLYKGSTYRWSESEDKLIMQAPEWAKRVIWVGGEYFLDDNVPSVNDTFIRKLISYPEAQFTKMFGKDFWKYLQHHRAFVNIPNHFEYKRILEMPEGGKYYNRYFPLPHVPVKGTWPTIQKLFKHIFGESSNKHNDGRQYSQYEMGLDYVQQLLINPTQMLPVLCLYSPENNTGKSTLGKLLMAMFGDNAVPISNNDLHSNFNEMFVDKLLAICDETLLERKADAEKIKAMSTAEKIMVNPKGSKQYSIDYFCKFIFSSNNLRMVYVSKHDQRYWIIRVPKLQEGDDDPNMLTKMKAEIPAFIEFLKNRTMHCPKEGRMYFHYSLLRTKIFEDMVKVNEPSEATNLRESIREWFMQDSKIEELQMTMKEIKEEFFNPRSSTQWISEILKDYIGVDLLRDLTGEAIFKRGTYPKYENRFSQDTKEEEIVLVNKPFRGRPYVFPRDQFVKKGDVKYAEAGDQVQIQFTEPAQHQKVIQGAIEEANTTEDTPF
jgi:hypothetical protein